MIHIALSSVISIFLYIQLSFLIDVTRFVGNVQLLISFMTQLISHICSCLILILGIFVPIPGVLLALSVPHWGYVVYEFPPFLCIPQNQKFWYYSAKLPINILLPIGVSLFVIMFWKLHKVRIITLTLIFNFLAPQYQGIFFTRKKSGVIISTAEKKILFVLFYYVIFGIIMLMYFGFAIGDADLFVEALETYFLCQTFGHLPNETSQCDPKEYQQHMYPELKATTYFLMAFITTARLTFVINWSTITKFCS